MDDDDFNIVKKLSQVSVGAAHSTYNVLMPRTPLKIHSELKLTNATLLLALSGWMDGGEVSSGTVKQVMGRREVKRIGIIEPDDFYIYNFPGTMEISALFRPEVKYDDGIVTSLEMPSNTFWADE